MVYILVSQLSLDGSYLINFHAVLVLACHWESLEFEIFNITKLYDRNPKKSYAYKIPMEKNAVTILSFMLECGHTLISI